MYQYQHVTGLQLSLLCYIQTQENVPCCRTSLQPPPCEFIRQTVTGCLSYLRLFARLLPLCATHVRTKIQPTVCLYTSMQACICLMEGKCLLNLSKGPIEPWICRVESAAPCLARGPLFLTFLGRPLTHRVALSAGGTAMSKSKLCSPPGKEPNAHEDLP